MWTRIVSSHQLKSIQVGTLLIKYPLSGNVVNALEAIDKEKISVRYVTKNIPAFEEFDVSLIPSQLEHFVHIAGLDSISLAVIHKYMDIIADGSYWIYQEK